MTMTITSPATPGTTSAAGTGIAPAGQPGASEDFLPTGIVGGQPAPVGVPADSAAPAQLFAHIMDAANEADVAQAKPAAVAVKDQTDTETATASTVDPAGLLAAMTGNLAAPVPVPTPPATPAPVAADLAVGAASGATLHPSATPFNLRAANIAVTTLPQASYTALQDANQLSLAQQAARVADGSGRSSWNAYADASAVTPSNPPPAAKAEANATLTATGSTAAPGATTGTAYPASAAQAIAAAAAAVPGAPAGQDTLFNPALAANVAAVPERQAGATGMTTATASVNAVAASATTTPNPAASPVATGAMAATATMAGPAAPTVAAPAAATSWAAATGQYFGDRKAATAAVASAALPLRAITGAAANAAMASYPAVADALPPRAMPAPAGTDLAVAAAPVTANSAHGSGTARDDGQTGGKFASTLATTAGATAPAVTAAAPMATGFTAPVKLAGAPEQWQQPLREALGDRLQVNLQRNNNQAVIRLDPPNMGSIEISIRQSAGALQVNLSASNSEVVRQLNAIGDSVRQDLATRQFSDVAVTVSTARTSALSQATPQQSYSQGQPDGGRQQQQEQERGRNPGRALYQDDSKPIFAMNDQE